MTQNDYTQLHNLGIKGVVVKVTEGTYYTNGIAANQIKFARNAGMVVSAYHYATFDSASAAVAEANYFANRLDSLNVGKNVTVVADIESDAVSGDIAGNLTAFWQTMTQRGYQNHVAYTMRYYKHLDALTSTTGKDRTWIAQYPYTPSANSLWDQDFGAWQFSSTGHLPGHSQNLDVSIDYQGLFTRENGAASTSTAPSSVSYDPIVSQKTVSYSGSLDQSVRADGLYASAPFYTSAATSVGNTAAKAYNGAHFTALQEETTAKGTFVQIRFNNGSVYWIDKRALAIEQYDTVTSKTPVSYTGSLDQNSRADGLYTAGPFFTRVATAIGNTNAKALNGQHFTALEEDTTAKGTFVEIKLNDGKIYWVDKRALAIDRYDKVISTTAVSYTGSFDQSSRADGLYASGPFFTSVATAVGNTNAKALNGQHFTAFEEDKTAKGTFVKVKLNDGSVYWTDKRALAIDKYDKILSDKKVDYSGVINQSSSADGLYVSGPFFTSVATAVGNTNAKALNGQHFTALEEKRTAKGTFVQIKLANGSLYWIDKRALDIAQVG